MAMPCCGISKKVTTNLPSPRADMEDPVSWARKHPNVPAASSAAVASTVTDRKLLFARPPVRGAARVRENWFLGSRGMPNPGRAGVGMSTRRFTRFRPYWVGAAVSSLSPGISKRDQDLELLHRRQQRGHLFVVFVFY